MPIYTSTALNFGGGNILSLVTKKVMELRSIRDPSSMSTIFTYVVPVERFIKVSDPLYTRDQKEHRKHIDEVLRQIELDAEMVQLHASSLEATQEVDDIIIEVSL